MTILFFFFCILERDLANVQFNIKQQKTIVFSFLHLLILTINTILIFIFIHMK